MEEKRQGQINQDCYKLDGVLEAEGKVKYDVQNCGLFPSAHTLSPVTAILWQDLWPKVETPYEF